jgi:hypothetical protein
MRSPTGANGYRKAGKWLRGVDLNHRALGYESNVMSLFGTYRNRNCPLVALLECMAI